MSCWIEVWEIGPGFWNRLLEGPFATPLDARAWAIGEDGGFDEMWCVHDGCLPEIGVEGQWRVSPNESVAEDK